jgi:hypothetical protein
MSTISDNFNRANEAPLAGNWSLITSHAAWNLTTNQIVPSGVGGLDLGAWYSGASWGPDQSSKAKLTVVGTSAGTGPGLCVRCASGRSRSTGSRSTTPRRTTW